MPGQAVIAHLGARIGNLWPWANMSNTLKVSNVDLGQEQSVPSVAVYWRGERGGGSVRK